MPDSFKDWRRVPTTTSILFGVDLPYHPPKGAVGRLLWRKRMWIETTFALSVLEPWEKIFVLCVTYFLLTLVLTGLLKFAPQQLALLWSRLVYYAHGTSPDGFGMLPHASSFATS
ncbi:hypothetical protein EIP91_009625, partial [Steccherinum ochraceum]